GNTGSLQVGTLRLSPAQSFPSWLRTSSFKNTQVGLSQTGRSVGRKGFIEAPAFSQKTAWPLGAQAARTEDQALQKYFPPNPVPPFDYPETVPIHQLSAASPGLSPDCTDQCCVRESQS